MQFTRRVPKTNRTGGRIREEHPRANIHGAMLDEARADLPEAMALEANRKLPERALVGVTANRTP
jgi:hypothetical protein